jgi:t-SNARE complex subunit (syntaxin)
MLNRAYDITERCEEIKVLAKNVRELYKMMQDISQMVKLQGEKIDNIADHVQSAEDYTREGVQKLEKAKEHHKSYRCVRFFVIMCNGYRN